MKMYAVIGTDSYIPVLLDLTFEENDAVESAKDYAEGHDDDPWENAKEFPGTPEPYFNQEEDGNMENSVTVTTINTDYTDVVKEKDLKFGFKQEMKREATQDEIARLIQDLSDNFDDAWSWINFCIGRLYK